jgi:hypothetical protein
MDDNEIIHIQKIEFSILGEKEILKMSELGENNNEIIELYKNSEPTKGSLIDSRINPNPVFNKHYLKENQEHSDISYKIFLHMLNNRKYNTIGEFDTQKRKKNDDLEINDKTEIFL